VSQYTFPPVTISSVGVDYEAANAATALPSTLAIIGGWTGTAITVLKTAADGALQVDIESSATITVSGTVAVSAIAAELPAGTQTIGAVTLATSTGVDIGTVGLLAGTQSIGTVILGAGSANIGALTAGTAEIGKLAAGTANIGNVSLLTGTQAIGSVTVSSGTITLAANSGVDIGDVDVTSIIPGVGATNLGKAIQSAQGVTDTGVPALVVRNDVLADLSGADGDYAPVQVNATGAVYTVLSASTAEIGKLAAGTASIGTVVLGAGSANIGALTAGTAEIGKLAAGTAAIGSVTIGTSTGVDIGNVGLLAGTNEIGKLGAGTAIIGKILPNAPVDFLDSGIIDTSTANIATGGTTVVASLAADCKEIEVVDDIGEYMSMRVGGAVKAYLPLGGGSVQVSLSATDAVQLYSETGTAIASGSIAINFLG